MTDVDQEVSDWATKHKISQNVVKVLTGEGYDSLEAISLLTMDDVNDINAKPAQKGAIIPRGQQKLLIKAVQQMTGDVATPPEGAEKTTAVTQTVHLQGQTHDDPYVTAVSGLLQQQQQQQRQNIGMPSNGGATPGMTQVQEQASWADPQVHLRMAGKIDVTYYDITDYVNVSGARDRVLNEGPDGLQVVVKTGPAKPKLETLSQAQWSLANLAILDKLVGEGALDKHGILDYLSHTAYMYRLMLTKDTASVFTYDREYRREQALHGYRWGTHALHLNDVHLLPKKTKPQQQQQQPRTRPPRLQGPTTSSGETICKKYNSSDGCTLTACKFMHVCSVTGCEKPHPATIHGTLK